VREAAPCPRCPSSYGFAPGVKTHVAPHAPPTPNTPHEPHTLRKLFLDVLTEGLAEVALFACLQAERERTCADPEALRSRSEEDES
jgi:hypothetical protein